MDSVETYRAIVKRVLQDYARIPYPASQGNINQLVVFDEERDHYLLIIEGWDKYRVHACILHFDIIDGKVWLQRNNTDCDVARELEAAGVPRDDIVLGFRRPELRQHTGYAVA